MNSKYTENTSQTDPEWIAEEIRRHVAESPENRLSADSEEPAFNTPLVGFSSGADPIYEVFRDHIGPFFLTPLRIFQESFPDEADIAPEELTVISYILPSTEATRKDHAAQTRHPSRRWAGTRYYGEKYNETLRRHVVRILDQAGILAVAPVISPIWRKVMEGRWAPCSNWSERHAAHAAGLGTFGLCDGLITPVGKAIRCGSVVARAKIPPTPRPYTDHHAWCLFYSHGICGKCIPRCPVQAIGPSGHDKQRCMEYTDRVMNRWVTRTYGIDTYACGLCQAGVPCTYGIPDPDAGR